MDRGLLPVPRGLMRVATAMTGREALFQRLFEPLVIADDETRESLGWTPALAQANAIDEVIAWWRSQSMIAGGRRGLSPRWRWPRV